MYVGLQIISPLRTQSNPNIPQFGIGSPENDFANLDIYVLSHVFRTLFVQNNPPDYRQHDDTNLIWNEEMFFLSWACAIAWPWSLECASGKGFVTNTGYFFFDGLDPATAHEEANALQGLVSAHRSPRSKHPTADVRRIEKVLTIYMLHASA